MELKRWSLDKKTTTTKQWWLRLTGDRIHLKTSQGTWKHMNIWTKHMLLECTALQQIRDEYYTAESLRTLFEMIPEACIVEFLREAGFFYLIWKAIYPIQQIIRITHQLKKFGTCINRHTLATPLDSVIRLQSINNWENPTCERRLMSLRMYVVVKQMKSNPT